MKEIRQEIREFILKDVNQTLARMGVSEEVKETKILTDSRCYDSVNYLFESKPIRQMPMMFKEVVVDGRMSTYIQSEHSRYFKVSEKKDVVGVELHYSYNLWGGGSNGCRLGSLVYLVDKDLPENFDDEMMPVEYYVKKVEGLTI